ncbi:MAG: DNA translocase FtsK 4TM domain-containing protein [Bacillota bacterium]
MERERTLAGKLVREALGIGLFCLGCYALLAGASHSPETSGWAGVYLKKAMNLMLGERTWFLIPFGLLATGVWMMAYPGKRLDWSRVAGALVLVASVTGAIHSVVCEPGSELRAALAGQGAGVIGGGVAFTLGKVFGFAGRWLVLLTGVVASLPLAFGVSPANLLGRAGHWLSEVYRETVTAIADYVAPEKENSKEPQEQIGQNGATSSKPSEVPEQRIPEPEERQPATRQLTVGADLGYRLPPLSLLQKYKVRPPKAEKNADDKKQLLEQTLASFGVSARVVDVSQGPSVTRFEVQPAPGVKVSTIVALANDIALSLAAPNVRIEAPVPGKSVVGIEVPNKEIAVVHLRDILASEEFRSSTSKLTVALGKEISGRPVVSDLDKLLHLLIAGATGSGKSVCLNCIICSLLYKATPSELKFVMIDPKMVELSVYDGIPHLLAPVVTDPRKAAGCLRWVVQEMENRYRMFVQAGVRDIARYNQVAGEKDFMPYIVVVIDELADLMMVAPVDVEDAIFRLAQMARAAGIHLVVATQRPSVDVITGTIKANIPSRIAFAVSSQVDSRTILDTAGAEKLLGRGDMLFMPLGAPKPIRAQGAFVSDREVEQLVGYLRDQAKPEYKVDVSELDISTSQDKVDEDDPLFPQAVRAVIEAGQASVSLLQRKLPIGYARAARLIDAMEKRGFIGPYDGSKPREVKIKLSEYDQLFGSRRRQDRQ